MFTPNRNKTSGHPSSRRSTPRISAIKNTPRNSFLRQSVNARNSLNVTNTSLLASPSVTTVFSSLHHAIESYETSIPVLVTEAIALSEDISRVKTEINDNGWSWIVSGLKLLVWSHFQFRYSKIPTCKELLLLGDENKESYSAAVHYNEGAGVVPVVAVSVTGQVIYWPNILTSTAAYFESKLQIAESLVDCKLTSTNNSIVIRELSKVEGIISRFSHRFSSFLFSTSPQDNVIKIIVSSTRKHGEYSLLLLKTSGLQQLKSVITDDQDGGTVQLVTEIDVKEVFSSKLSIKFFDCVKPLNLCPLDIQFASHRGQVAVLVAISEAGDMEAPVHYAVILIDNLENLESAKLLIFQYEDSYVDFHNAQCCSHKLLVRPSSSHCMEHFAMCNNNRAVVRSRASNDGDYVEDTVPFQQPGDAILSAGCSGGRIIFFSAIYGLVTPSFDLDRYLPSILGESTMEASYMTSPGSNSDVSLAPVVSQSKIDQLQSSDNAVQKLQAAFLHYCKLNLDQAQSIVASTFTLDHSSDLLDNAVGALSGEFLDDYPAQDPRWAESVPRDMASDVSGSFILLHQLEDKLKAHTLYLKFLTDVGIWDRLFLAGGARDKVVTRWLLWEHAEKLHASISLQQKHASYQSLVDAAIRQALRHRDNVTSKAGLTPRDYFYREVTKIDDIFDCLLQEEETLLNKSSLSSQERVATVVAVNSIMEGILHSVKQYRKSNNLIFCDKSGCYHEYIPWTVGSGRMSVRNIILQQFKICIDKGFPEAEDGQQRALLSQSYSALADLLLDGYRDQVTSLSQSDATLARGAEVQSAFANHRDQIISPLIKLGLRDKASSLAEKYLALNLLVQICDTTNDDDRLKKYIAQFSSQGFSEYLCRWYLDRKEYRKLLNCGEKLHPGELKTFLKAHPNLAWMEQVKTGQFVGANETLLSLANSEKKSLSKKKTYLSLSKLSAAFSGAEKEVVEKKIDDINREQLLMKYQESLPSAIQSKHGDNMPVYTPGELIQMYTGDTNESSTEGDFKKAFELLSYLPPAPSDGGDEESVDAEEWKLRIWSRLILKDDWKNVDAMLDPLLSCSHTLLARTVALVNTSGLLGEILPNLNLLLRRPELNDLASDPTFNYLMQANFESMKRSVEVCAS